MIFGHALLGEWGFVNVSGAFCGGSHPDAVQLQIWAMGVSLFFWGNPPTMVFLLVSL